MSFGYLLSTICLAYTHVYGLFVIIAQNAYVVVLLLWSREHTLRTRNWIALQVIVVALFAPWIPVMMAQIAGSQISSKPHLITTATIVPTLVATFKAYSGSVVLLCLFLALSLLSLFAYHAKGGAAGWKTPFRALHFDLSHVNGTGPAAVSFLIIWLFTLNVLPMVICLESALVYVVRYSIAASVALYLLVAVGIRNLSVPYIKVAVVGIVIVLCAAPLPAYYTTIVNPQAREVIHSVDEHLQAGEAVLVWPESHIVVWAYYNTKAEINATTFGSPTKSIDENAKELNSSLSGSPRVWFICADYGRDPRVLAILKIFNESYETASYTHYVGYNLYLFVKRG